MDALLGVTVDEPVEAVEGLLKVESDEEDALLPLLVVSKQLLPLISALDLWLSIMEESEFSRKADVAVTGFTAGDE